MDSPPDLNDNRPFLDIQARLKNAGLNVPDVMEKEIQQGFFILTDLGTRHYLDILEDKNVEALYQDAMSAIVKMQLNARYDGLPIYDESFLRMEMNLFPEWYVKCHKNRVMTSSQEKTLESVFARCAASAVEQPAVFVHRDYHSRNLMFSKTDNPAIIDFQGAVLGPVTYDIVSLLKDCYIRWPDELIYRLLETFRLQLSALGICSNDRETFERWFDYMGLQRHIKVMGIFCRLNYRDGTASYLNDLPLVFSYIDQVCRKYKELDDFRGLLADLGADEEFS